MSLCIVCSKHVEDGKLFKDNTCSYSCHSKLSNRIRIDNKTHNFIVINNSRNKNVDIAAECLECHIIFDKNNKDSKFCSKSCAAKYNNRIRKKNGYSQKRVANKVVKVTCLECKKEYQIKNAECSDMFYCKECRKKWKEDKDNSSSNVKDYYIRRGYKVEDDKCTKGRKLRLNINTDRECVCKGCGKTFMSSTNRKFCSKDCRYHSEYAISSSRNGGLKSVITRSKSRRSKNEIYFSELIKERFNNVLNNVKMFNGWDCDIILPDLKIAVAWNGIWHYKRVMKRQSLEKVINRDKIKRKEIEKMNYLFYEIKDLGSFNKEFVEKQFEVFLDYVNSKNNCDYNI